MAFADLSHVRAAYDPEIPEGSRAEEKVQWYLDVASARLSALVVGIEDRLAEGDPNFLMLVRDVVVQAVLRQFDHTYAAQQVSQSAGPYTLNINTASRVNRGWFYEDELALLRGVSKGFSLGTIKLKMPDWSLE